MVLDRLSDVAGPLRPKELFAPYLSAYPLPSGTHYVVARTWQDLTVARAGCVRTMSILIDADAWAFSPPLVPILRLLSSSELPIEADAARRAIEEEAKDCIPSVSEFNANELLEALFLEDVKAVVVFDAPNPELIASRLLLSLWPDMRRRFSLSTFALSPRKANGRDLDLTFAPSSVKAKFADWPGRRVDGRYPQTGRHRWTSMMACRVFEEPVPKLLSERELNLLGDRDADSAAALRIALLWNELLDKLDRTPIVALGLLDIANSGLVNNAAALQSLEPRLAEATSRATSSLTAKDAWDFVGAIARKMQGHNMPASRTSVAQLTAQLAECAPDGVISFLGQPDPSRAIDELIPSIATGLGKGAAPFVEQVLCDVPTDTIARLVLQSGALADRVAKDDRLVERMRVVLTTVDSELASRVGVVLLPFLVEDRHLSAAIPIFYKLDTEGIAAELRWLRDANSFKAKQLGTALIERARETKCLPVVRDILTIASASPERNELLARTVAANATDVLWLLDEQRLTGGERSAILVSLLRRASDSALADVFSDRKIGERIVEHFPNDADDILTRLSLLKGIPVDLYVYVIEIAITRVDDAKKLEIAQFAMARCLCTRFDGDEAAVLSLLLGILGSQIDVGWTARVGLGDDCDATVASRNLIAFDLAPSNARLRFVGAIDEVARALCGRRYVDLTEEAYDACAQLMFDAEKTSVAALIKAASWLMPSLLRARHQPVSRLIAALFPVIYQELAKTDDVSDLLKVFSFFDWDRCKAARRELVDAFMASSWHAGDLALTACRCADVDRILKRVAESYGGHGYLIQIENDLSRLDDDARHIAARTISNMRSDRSFR